MLEFNAEILQYKHLINAPAYSPKKKINFLFALKILTKIKLKFKKSVKTVDSYVHRHIQGHGNG